MSEPALIKCERPACTVMFEPKLSCGGQHKRYCGKKCAAMVNAAEQRRYPKPKKMPRSTGRGEGFGKWGNVT